MGDPTELCGQRRVQLGEPGGRGLSPTGSRWRRDLHRPSTSISSPPFGCRDYDRLVVGVSGHLGEPVPHPATVAL